MGDDFYGVWDRQRPDLPIETYPKTEEGKRESIDRWAKLADSDSLPGNKLG
jgi:hypothetical protein